VLLDLLAGLHTIQSGAAVHKLGNLYRIHSRMALSAGMLRVCGLLLNIALGLCMDLNSTANDAAQRHTSTAIDLSASSETDNLHGMRASNDSNRFASEIQDDFDDFYHAAGSFLGSHVTAAQELSPSHSPMAENALPPSPPPPHLGDCPGTYEARRAPGSAQKCRANGELVLRLNQGAVVCVLGCCN
jgi:hypothetical protein